MEFLENIENCGIFKFRFWFETREKAVRVRPQLEEFIGQPCEYTLSEEDNNQWLLELTSELCIHNRNIVETILMFVPEYENYYKKLSKIE